jgi:hypothetical protein
MLKFNVIRVRREILVLRESKTDRFSFFDIRHIFFLSVEVPSTQFSAYNRPVRSNSER